MCLLFFRQYTITVLVLSIIHVFMEVYHEETYLHHSCRYAHNLSFC